MVGVLSAITVAIQKSKRADDIIIHMDKLKPYLGKAPATWEVSDAPDALSESLTEFSTPRNSFEQVIRPTRLAQTLNPSMRWGTYRALLATSQRLAPGTQKAVSGAHAKIPLRRKVDQFRCVAHPYICATIIA